MGVDPISLAALGALGSSIFQGAQASRRPGSPPAVSPPAERIEGGTAQSQSSSRKRRTSLFGAAQNFVSDNLG